MDHRAIRFIGSIRLAVPLLTIIVGVLIWATFYEAQLGSATVQQAVYKSPWFGALMFLLALNLGVSALSRYPWRGARKIGFALTHLGLIVIIAGAAAVIHLGVEGMLPLRTDSGINNQIRSEGDLLEVMTPDGKIEQTELWIKPDGTVAPEAIAELNVLGYSENTIKTVSFTEGTVNNLAVRLSLNSDRMGHLERWLAVAPVAYSKVPIGPAKLEMIKGEEIEQQLSPPETNQSPWGTLRITAQGSNTTTIDVQKYLFQTVKLDDLSITLVNYWSDFRLDANRQPYNASETFNNPAVQLEISSPQGTERWFVFNGNPPVRARVSGAIAGVDIRYQIQTPSAAYFRVITTPSGELYYAAQSSHGFKSGALKPGDSVTPGWADFQITLEEVIPHAQLNRQIVPVDDAVGSPALLVEVADKKVWLPWGEPTAINTSKGEMFAAFSPKLLQLPFAIALEDFIVERNEGSESVAMWTSKIRIHDPQRGISDRNVWMNHPTWYQGWKIAQASWNPGDLKQSTLQVKREPAWVTALTWTGSALIVCGIAVMFYGPALTRRRSKPISAATSAPPLETESAEELVVSR